MNIFQGRRRKEFSNTTTHLLYLQAKHSLAGGNNTTSYLFSLHIEKGKRGVVEATDRIWTRAVPKK